VTPPRCDLHHHLWPEALLEGLRARRERPRLRGSRLELPSGDWEADLGAHTLEARLAELDRHEVDVAVISCPPTLELDDALTEAYHAGAAELVAAARGRLRALACGSARDGFAGACVAASDLLDLRALAPVLDELEREGSLLFVHPGPASVPPGAPRWWPAVVDYTAQMQAAYAAWFVHGSATWRSLRVVFAILAGGAPFQLERLASRGVDTRGVLDANVYFDVASYGHRALELTLSTYGVGQLVYGSDAPVIDPSRTMRAIRGFGEAVSDAVCRSNPARILR
jgi:predicted TIM-barrel fold metal-dependent hydrolase